MSSSSMAKHALNCKSKHNECRVSDWDEKHAHIPGQDGSLEVVVPHVPPGLVSASW